MNEIVSIKGGRSKDSRGEIRYVNDFDMTSVKRFYIIKNSDTISVRGWRGHRIEQRWFYVISGSFSFKIVKIDNWESPSKSLPILTEELKVDDMKILNVPPGHCVAIRALEPESELLVYADYPLSHASQDDYVWEIDYFC
ncbi:MULTISPECIES: WxcM-like domain-containing protein [unclassified Sphingobacterium]|uniref:WxcM-like domain-containing protein n=1 Tax=unclassified Sphingobacterium TaxID=2609468 RepID=UPI0025E3D2E8|nr:MULTISPECIES: WxcM-like domain-containing protein [unclassified Sphingobacterium]